jgi:hypothetical protein
VRARAAIVARHTAGGGDIDNGAFDEGSDNDEAAESAARHGYASAASDDDEASAPAARHVRAASAARGTAEGGYIVVGTSDEGSNNNEAAESTARCAYASATSDEALAPAARHVRVVSVARGTAKGGYIVDGTSDEGSDDNEAEASAARQRCERRLRRRQGSVHHREACVRSDGGKAHGRRTSPTTSPIKARGDGLRRKVHAHDKGSPTHGRQQGGVRRQGR